jgi:hypothetical protein
MMSHIEGIPMRQHELHRYHTLHLVLEHRLTGAEEALAEGSDPSARAGATFGTPAGRANRITGGLVSRRRHIGMVWPSSGMNPGEQPLAASLSQGMGKQPNGDLCFGNNRPVLFGGNGCLQAG